MGKFCATNVDCSSAPIPDLAPINFHTSVAHSHPRTFPLPDHPHPNICLPTLKRPVFPLPNSITNNLTTLITLTRLGPAPQAVRTCTIRLQDRITLFPTALRRLGWKARIMATADREAAQARRVQRSSTSTLPPSPGCSIHTLTRTGVSLSLRAQRLRSDQKAR